MATIPSTSPEKAYVFQPRLPEAKDGYDAENERQFRRSLSDAFLALGAKPAQARPYLYAADYKVVGDGVADDTVAMQAALTDGAAQHKVVYAGSMTVKITGPLTMSGPGLLFDDCAFGSAGDAGILVTGTGYTALTITGRPSQISCTVYGTGNTANGVYFNNPILSHIHSLRVYKLDGFGVKIDKCYDCVFGTISVEECGNSSNYAFSVNDGGDTSNMSHFLRLQVELATQKAISISPNTFQCVFHNIHSERAHPTAGVDTWLLGGHATVYVATRVTGDGGATRGTCHLQSADSDYIGLFVDATVDCYVEAIVGTVKSACTLHGPRIEGTLHPTNGQIGRIQIHGGYITSFVNDPGTLFRVTNTLIGTLSVGITANPPVAEWATFVNCEIDTLTSLSTLAAATFESCVITDGGQLLGGITRLVNSKVTCGTTVTHDTSSLIMIGSTLVGALTYKNNRPIRMAAFSSITGTVSCGDAGAVDFLCDDTSTVGGGSTGVGVPTGGAHVIGDRHKNPIPSAGNPKAWVCTVAGAPGTFVSEGNL